MHHRLETTARLIARPVMLGTALTVGAYGVWVASGRCDLGVEAVVSSFGLVILHLLFAGFAFSVAARARPSPRLRRSWLLLALSGAFGAAAEACWFYLETVLRTEPHYSSADFFFWLQGASLLAGVLSFPFVARSAYERSLFSLDMAIVVTAGLMVLWHSTVAPLQAQPPGRTPAAYVLSYVVLNLLTLAAVTAVVQSEVDQVSRRTLSLLAAGMLFGVGADGFSVYALLLDVRYYPPSLNAAWVAGAMLTMLAAAWEAGRAEEASEPGMALRPRARVVLPYTAVIFGMSMLALALESSSYGLRTRGVLLGACLLVSLVLLRQILVLRENARLYEQAQRAAVTDPLTGLYNRLFVDRALRTEVERAHRHKQILSLLVIDVDDFKRINDELGHARGDSALVAIAEVLRSQSRAADVLGRFGGDEFVALLPGAGEQGAHDVAGRMMECVGRIPFEGRGLRVSVGAACLMPDMGAKELLDRADRDMYVCKSGGASHRERKATPARAGVTPTQRS